MLDSLFKSPPLPEKSYAELITLLISGRLPIAIMALTVVVVAMCQQFARWDPTTLVLASAVIALLMARAFLVTAFIRKNLASQMSGNAMRTWENRYAGVVTAYAALLGLFNFNIVLTGSESTRLLVVAETYGFCAGMVSRGFVRPRLCAATVLIGALPTAAGMLTLAIKAEAATRLTYAVIGILFVVYAVSSLETVRHLYRAVLAQLATKHVLAGLARIDPLTGLPNRLAMIERLTESAGRHNEPDDITLILIDLDGFKAVNDKFGHPTGDRLLSEVAQRLTNALRADDLAVRMGGDEFAIIQSGQFARKDAEALSVRLIAVISEPYLINGTFVRIGLSIGIATSDGGASSGDELIERADTALYQAKRYGGNTFRFWQTEPLLTIAS